MGIQVGGLGYMESWREGTDGRDSGCILGWELKVRRCGYTGRRVGIQGITICGRGQMVGIVAAY